MAHESSHYSGLGRTLRDLFADLSDLVQKEIRLAKAEVTEKVTTRISAIVWMAVAGVLGLVVALLLVEAAVFALASFGFALHWACLMVAAGLAVVAAAAFLYGRSLAGEELLPSRTVHQITEDIRIAKEQLS